MKTTITANGNLKITMEDHDIEYLEGDYDDRSCHAVDELRDEYMFILPEWIGALTDAPILVTWDDIYIPPDNSQPRLRVNASGGIWWYPDYQILCPWEQLLEHGEVIFTKAPEGEWYGR